MALCILERKEEIFEEKSNFRGINRDDRIIVFKRKWNDQNIKVGWSHFKQERMLYVKVKTSNSNVNYGEKGNPKSQIK